MIRKITFSIVLFLLCSPGFSQVLIALVFGDKLNNDKIEMGVQLAAQGFQFTGISDKLDLGFSFGAYLDVKLSERFVISNYFMFKSPKGGKQIPSSYWFNPDDQTLPDGVDTKRHLSYFELTPMFRYQFNSSWSTAIGPQFALNSKATDIYQYDTEKGTVTYRTNIRDHITLMDVGMAIDVQWRLMKGNGLRINARFAQGFINVYKDGELVNAKNQTYMVGVGIPISGRKTK